MIGCIAAMPVEKQAIVDRMKECETRMAGEVEFTRGRLEGQDVVVALSGVGKVSAAIASALMCILYKPDCLISIGVAGGLRQEQQVGDIVFSNTAIQADFDTSPVDGPSGLGLSFQADPILLKHAIAAARLLDIEPWVGTVASQDLFLARQEDYEKLAAHFPASMCAEMEGGAVAQCAARFKIPFLVIRSLSDVVVHNDNPVEFETFANTSALRAADILEKICRLAQKEEPEQALQ